MAFTDEGNFALKDMLIRSEFRLVDAELRVGDAVVRQRVSSLIQRQLGLAEENAALVADPSFPPGVTPLSPISPPAPIGGVFPEPEPERVAVTAPVLVGKQVYTVRGDSSTATVFRGARLTSSGFLVRVSGEMVSAVDIRSTDEGLTFLISDADEDNSIGRLGGDHDLINMGSGDPVSGDHAIGLIQTVTAAGFVPPSRFDVAFFTPVRAGQRLCVEQDVAVGLSFYAVFEVAQFSEGGTVTQVIRERIVESVRVPPPIVAFTPVMMVFPEAPTNRRVALNLGSFKILFEQGFRPVGNVTASGVSLV